MHSLSRGERQASPTLLGWMLLSLSPTSGGCANTPGNYWGEVQASLGTYFKPSESRLTSDAYLKTGNNFAIDLDDISWSLDTLTVAQRKGDAVSFDPADPPPGYSLCHNGHCHADDGSQVDYSEVEAEVNGGTVVGFSVSMPIQDTFILQETSQPVPLGPCSSECVLEYGELESVSVGIVGLSFSGRVYDLTSQIRVPDSGLAITGTLGLTAPATAPLAGAADKKTPSLIQIALQLPLTERLFDGADWGVLEANTESPAMVQVDSAIALQLVANLNEFSTLDVELTRSEP